MSPTLWKNEPEDYIAEVARESDGFYQIRWMDSSDQKKRRSFNPTTDGPSLHAKEGELHAHWRLD